MSPHELAAEIARRLGAIDNLPAVVLGGSLARGEADARSDIDLGLYYWLYRDLARVAAVIAECERGRTACHYQPGHPHGFHTHIYMGEVHHGRRRRARRRPPCADTSSGWRASSRPSGRWPCPLEWGQGIRTVTRMDYPTRRPR